MNEARERAEANGENENERDRIFQFLDELMHQHDVEIEEFEENSAPEPLDPLEEPDVSSPETESEGNNQENGGDEGDNEDDWENFEGNEDDFDDEIP